MGSFSIFSVLREEGVLREAEDDNQATTEPTPTTSESEAEPAADNNTEEVGDDDFDIDASLDDEENGGDEPEGDSPSTDDGGGDSGSSNSDIESGDDEVNDDNTDIFASLTAEEQQIKIKELKELFQSMYESCDELLDKLNNLEFTEDNLPVMTRLIYSIYDLKKYIKDYIVLVFPKKSFVENDIAFNRFLMVLNSISDILIKYQKKEEKDDQ